MPECHLSASLALSVIDNKCLEVFIIFRTWLIYGEKKPPAPPQAQHMPIHFAAEAISKPEP